MNRLIGLVSSDPMILVWIFVLGLASGGGMAWKVQGWRIDAVQAKFDGFAATVKAQGEAARKSAKAKADEDDRNKKSADHEYQITIDSLTADVKRMRDDRARTGYVPAAPAGSRSPGVACFDRAELEQALRRFDEGVTGIIGEGDADAVGLNVARTWAQAIRK